MYLVDKTGRALASVWERPVGPRNWTSGAISGICDRCGERTTREHCTIHVAVVVPHDRDGGYFTPWSCRCRSCEIAVVGALYGLAPESGAGPLPARDDCA